MNKIEARSCPQPAYSMVFAFLMMTIILIIAGTTIENTTEKVRYFNELEATSQARLAAESAVEVGIMAIKDYEAGYETSDSYGTPTSDAFCYDASSGGSSSTTCTSSGDYDIASAGQANDVDGVGYYVPIPGTGTAAPSEDCSIKNAHVTVDDPCNWNKLVSGGSVTIPLYISDGSTGIYTPADLGLSEWDLKVRTPCVDGSYDSGCTRFTLDYGGEYASGATVIFWQIIGVDSDGNVYSEVPNDEVERSGFSYDRSGSNTEIYEELIDSASSTDFVVLDVNASSTQYSDLYDATQYSDTTLESLVLQLDIVSTLEDATNGTIPYLEWQFESDVPLADNKAVLVGDGYYSGQSGTFYYPYVITRSSIGESTSIYTLSN